LIYWLVYLLILSLGCAGLITLLIRLHKAQTARPLLENLTLLTLTIFITLMGLEFYFKVFFAETDDLDTLARQNWRDRYYVGTFNSFGYRDKEWTDEMVAGKTKVMVIGDSFVEGVGIKHTEDRFPDRLDQLLGPDFVVFNIGRRGASTGREIDDVIEYPYPPDILVLSYFVNDIDEIALSRGIMEPPKMPPISPLLSPLVNNSYAFNFFYWRLFRLLQASQPDDRWLWRLRAYNDPDAWWLHQKQLLSLYKGTQSEQIPFVVVVFPSLVEGIPSKDLIASSVDAHPNEMVHKLVAEALYEKFVELGLVSPNQHVN
jgi:hypothetical protein